jgi:hypothetical protein
MFLVNLTDPGIIPRIVFIFLSLYVNIAKKLWKKKKKKVFKIENDVDYI